MMDRMPIGMAACKTGANHTPVINIVDSTIQCMDCDLAISEWNIYIPERDDTVTLWLSEVTIYEEPF